MLIPPVLSFTRTEGVHFGSYLKFKKGKTLYLLRISKAVVVIKTINRIIKVLNFIAFDVIILEVIIINRLKLVHLLSGHAKDSLVN